MSANLYVQIISEKWPVVLPPAVAELPPDITRVPTDDLWDIADPWQKLRDKYFDGGTVLSREFDLYAARRSTDSGWRNRLEGADITATLLMHSQAESRDVDTLFGRSDAIEVALSAVPTDLDLADADLDADLRLRADLAELFRVCKLTGIGVAKASKLLCLKRPRLIPMIDQYVRKALYNRVADIEPPLPDKPEEFGRRVVQEVTAFRRVMLWEREKRGPGLTNLVVLQALAGELNRELASGAGLTGEIVTPVRVLDNLLWMDWYGAVHHFGYRYDQAAERIVKS